MDKHSFLLKIKHVFERSLSYAFKRLGIENKVKEKYFFLYLDKMNEPRYTLEVFIIQTGRLIFVQPVPKANHVTLKRRVTTLLEAILR